MNTKIATLLCAPLIVTGLAAQGGTQNSDHPKASSRLPVDVSVEGIVEESRRTGTNVAPSGHLDLSARLSGGSLTPLDCLARIADQATGGCLIASSTPSFGALFPYPGTNNQASALAFVGGGQSNKATRRGAAVVGGYGNTASDYLATVGGGRFGTASAVDATVGGGSFNTASAYGATVGGGLSNVASGSGATVGGGGGAFTGNIASGTVATVAGGDENVASGSGATVGGGYGNVASAFLSPTVVGGVSNRASGNYAAVGGGRRNNASGPFAAVAGGSVNAAHGDSSMVPGGLRNTAQGNYSFAAGHLAMANHTGTFVWGDSQFVLPTKPSSVRDEFNVYASGGVRMFTNSTATTGVRLVPGSSTWTMVSDRDAKENIEPVDARAVLDKVAGLPLATWNYAAQDDSIRHMGPMAQDFYAVFGLGLGEKTIDTIDPNGVALAAIQGLNEVVKEKDAEIERNRTEIADLRAANEALLARVERLEALARALVK